MRLKSNADSSFSEESIYTIKNKIDIIVFIPIYKIPLYIYWHKGSK